MGNGNDPGAAHESQGGLDAHNSAVVRRGHDRAIGFRANRHGRGSQPPPRRTRSWSRSDCGPARTDCESGRPSAPTAAGVRRADVGPLAQIGLAQNHRSRVAQFFGHERVLGGYRPTSASEPAVVCIWSRVAILSLMRTGTPCNGLLAPCACRSRSSASAISSASGFASITEFTPGPCLSIASMRSKYFSVMPPAVSFPDFSPSPKERHGGFVEFEWHNSSGGAQFLSLRDQRRSGGGRSAHHAGFQKPPAIHAREKSALFAGPMVFTFRHVSHAMFNPKSAG